MASIFTMSNVLWATQPLLEGAVVYSLWRRKMYKDFPFFTAFLIFQMVSVFVLFPAYNFASDHFFYHYWFYFNWTASFVEFSLGFKVLHEICIDIFSPYRALKDLGTVLFRWGVLVMLLVGVVVAASAKTDLPMLAQVGIAMQRCVRVSQLGLVLFLLSFSSHLGMRWKHRSFGLALGFGFISATELFVFALRYSNRGFISRNAADVATLMAFDISVMIWFAYCWMVQSPAAVPESTRLKTQRWDRSFGEMQNPQTTDSLIPMFEGMVDRALARSPGLPKEPSALAEGNAAGR